MSQEIIACNQRYISKECQQSDPIVSNLKEPKKWKEKTSKEVNDRKLFIILLFDPLTLPLS